MMLELKQLEYPKTNRFTIPYLPHIFYVITFILLGTLVPLNIALVGSDVVTTLRSDPTAVVDPWWMPDYWPKFLRLRTIPQICQPVAITDDVPLRTNSSVPLFKYVLRHGSVAGNENDPTNRIYPAPYMANPLQNCQVKTITLNMELPTKVMTYTITVRCSLGGNKNYSFRIPDNVTFSTTYQRASNGDLGPDDMINYLAFSVVPEAAAILQAGPSLNALPSNSSSSNNVLGVLDAMQADLFKVLWAQMSVWNSRNLTYPRTHVIEWTAGPLCRSDVSTYGPLNTTCNNAMDPRRIVRWYGSTADYTYNPTFMADFNVTLINAFITLRDAIMIDLGNVDPTSNIYFNKSSFDNTIQTDPFLVGAFPIVTTLSNDRGPITPDIYWRSCTWGWNCVNTTSWADVLRATPENVPVNNLVLPYMPGSGRVQTTSVLSFGYLCPTFQKKSTDSLLASVFVATATMFSVIYSVFATVMPKVERQYQKRKEGEGRAINPNDEDRPEVCPLVGSTAPYDSPQTLYGPSSGTGTPYKHDGYDYTSPSVYQPYTGYSVPDYATHR